jgi:uncharacterized OB-fold protein
VDSYLGEAYPLPAARADGLDAGFWQAARERRLVVQRCSTCGEVQFPPEVVCRQCQSADLDWVDVRPSGHIFSYVRVWHAGSPAAAARVPYLVAVVDVIPGKVRFVGNLLGDPHEEITIGTAVHPEFEDHDDITLIQWRVSATSSS